MSEINTCAMKGLPIGGAHPCFIVAEIGQNHQGDLNLAKELINLAKECGANCVKFQKSSLSHRFTNNSLANLYENENSFGRTYGEHRSKLEFSDEQLKELQQFAKEEVGVMFTASAMDIPSADLLVQMDVPFVKIGSGDTNNLLLIEHVAQTGYPIVLSTGMQDLCTIQEVVQLVNKYHNNMAILHCVSSYPTLPEDVNLSVIDAYRKEFPTTPIGYSGHEKGIAISIAAVARGAKIIERHFTKDKNLKGTDHKCSLNPEEFKRMVDWIREVELAVGKPIKKILPCEIPCHEKLGKSLVAARHLKKGTVLQLGDIAVKVCQPHGIAPQNIAKVIGKVVQETVEDDCPICYQNLQ